MMTNNFLRLLGTNLKRDLKFSLIWLALIALMIAASIGKLVVLYGGAPADLKQLVAMLNTPMMTAFFAKIPTLPHYNLAILFGALMLPLMGVLFALFNMQLAIKSTRVAEESGATELLRATAIKAQTPVTTTIAELIIINVGAGLITYGALISTPFNGSTLTGNLLFAIGLACFGLFFGGIALVAAQLFTEARTASMFAYTILGAAYVARMVLDMRNLPHLTWFSPFNWLEALSPYHTNHWGYVSPMLIIGLLLMICALYFVNQRDLGTGIIATTDRGKLHASPLLQNFTGLFWRLEQKTLLGWTVGTILMAAMFGSLFGDIADLFGVNATISKLLGVTQANTLQTTFYTHFIGMLSLLLTMLAILAGLNIMQRQHKDATSGAYDLLSAQPLTRRRLYLTYVIGGLLTSVVIWSIGFGVIILIARASVSNLQITLFLPAFWGYLPAILVSVGIVASFVGWLPRLLGSLYAYFGIMFLLTYVKNLLDFPTWFLKLSPFGWVETIPVSSVSNTLLWSMIGLAIILMYVGYLGFNRRDLV